MRVLLALAGPVSVGVNVDRQLPDCLAGLRWKVRRSADEHHRIEAIRPECRHAEQRFRAHAEADPLDALDVETGLAKRESTRPVRRPSVSAQVGYDQDGVIEIGKRLPAENADSPATPSVQPADWLIFLMCYLRHR
jgi:hypothetical protein